MHRLRPSLRLLVLTCLLFTLSPVLTGAAEAPFTLEAVLSAPHATGLVAAPVGDRVAWVENDQGVRNVWAAEGPDWVARQLTGYGDDDGQAIGDLAFTPDGARVLYVRGGGPNAQGDLPNPASDPDGVEQALWIVPFAGDEEARKLAETGTFEVFPGGGRVAFVKDSQVWTMPLAAVPEPDDDVGEVAGGGEESEESGEPDGGAEELFTVRRGVSGLRISPDGGKIAFVSDRAEHSFVGVYDLADERLTWLSPSVDRDWAPVWSPEGDRVAFLRVPNEAEALPFTPRREGLPWSIRVADVETGESRELFRAAPGAGSAFGAGYWFVGDRLWWGTGDRIVFTWEKTGRLHLWAIPVGGGEAVDLSPGDGVVQYAELSPDGSAMLYASNHGDVDRRHLWRSSVLGGPPEQLTSGDGIEWAPALTAETHTLAFLASGATTPAHAEVLAGGTRRPLGSQAVPEGFPADELVVPDQVVFEATDDLPIHGQLFAPPERCGEGPHPGLLFFHGGSRRQMLLGFHPSNYYANAYAFNQAMAARCFVVMAVNFRSGIGYGLEFREALDYGARGASEFRDVVGAGRYLASRPDVDPERIGLWGGSYGGYLTALGLARAPELFAAGVDLHGVHDWNAVIGNFVPTYDPETREEAARLARESSPMADLSRWRAPVLLIHGDDDRNVPFSESVTLAEALRRRGVSVEALVFPDEVHGFLLHRNWLAAYRAAAEFLARELESSRS